MIYLAAFLFWYLIAKIVLLVCEAGVCLDQRKIALPDAIKEFKYAIRQKEFYWLPFDYLSDPVKTALHFAIMEMERDGEIMRTGEIQFGTNFEKWEVSRA